MIVALAATAITGIASRSPTPSASLWLALVVGFTTAALASQPLLLTDPVRITGIDGAAMPAMVGLAWLSPVQFLIALSLGQAAGWLVRRKQDGVPLRSEIAWLKFGASQATSLVYIAGALALYHSVSPDGPTIVVLTSASSALVAEALAAASMACIIGRSERALPRQLLHIARAPVLWLVVLAGGMTILLPSTQRGTALVLLAAGVSLWGLGRYQQRQQEELSQLRALVRVARDIPTLDHPSLVTFLTDRARDLTHARWASLDTEPAHGTSFGVPVDDGETWLNVHERTRAGETFRPSERETLRGLASLASLALQTVSVTEELRHAARHDQLTGLVSRRGLEDQWQTMAHRAARHTRSLGVVYLDLDGFKQINDQDGHAAGDALLCETGRRLSAVARDSDIVCRLGGDEFVLLAEDVRDIAALDALVERVTDKMTTGTTHHDGTISASVGAALYPEHGTSLEEVLKVADANMYVAKRASARRIDT